MQVDKSVAARNTDLKKRDIFSAENWKWWTW